MNSEERIEASLRRRPSDERTYDEPLAALSDGSVRRLRPTTSSRMRTGALPALVVVTLVVAVAAGALAVGVFRGSTTGPNPGSNDFELTGRVACFGQGPGFSPGPQGTSGEGCQLMAVPPAGYTAGTWTLDPAYPFSAGATEIHVLVTEWACHGFATAEGLIVKNVEYRRDAVVVTLAIRARQGAQTCPGTAPTPYVIRLAGPVGDRDLFDGGSWPAMLMARGGGPRSSPTPARTFLAYKVKSGDTLSSIAAQFGVSLEQLIAANPQLSNPIGIFVAQIIYIPWPGWVPNTPSPPPASPSRPCPVWAGPGGTLRTIAAVVGIPLADLMAANPQITDPDQPVDGESVCIPWPYWVPSPSPAVTFIVYVVKRGDTLSSIAAKYGVSLEQLIAANPQLAHPNLILVGEILYIPWQSWIPPSPSPAPPSG